MDITPQLVEHIVGLARLELPADEREELRGQLQRILGAVAKLDACKLDACDVPEPSQAETLREDTVTPCLGRDQALANAPAKTEEGFAVPRVIDGAEVS